MRDEGANGGVTQSKSKRRSVCVCVARRSVEASLLSIVVVITPSSQSPSINQNRAAQHKTQDNHHHHRRRRRYRTTHNQQIHPHTEPKPGRLTLQQSSTKHATHHRERQVSPLAHQQVSQRVHLELQPAQRPFPHPHPLHCSCPSSNSSRPSSNRGAARRLV